MIPCPWQVVIAHARRTRRPASSIPTALAVLCMGSCGGDGGPAREVNDLVPQRVIAAARTRDSAGVTISENGRNHAYTRLRTAERPSLVLGREDQPLYRVIGALQLQDGRIVVGNSGADELHYYSPTGELLQRVGGSGGGPGEFGWLQSLRRDGPNSVWTYDLGQFRVTRFGPDGSVTETITIRTPVAGDLLQPSVLGTFADGRLAVWQEAFELETAGPPGVVADTGFVYRYDPKDADAEAVIAFEETEFVVSEEPVNPGPRTRFTKTPRVFGAMPILEMVGGRVLYADNRRFELRLFDDAGQLKQIIRRWEEPRSPTDDDIDRVLRPRKARSRLRRRWRGGSTPEGTRRLRSCLLWIGAP